MVKGVLLFAAGAVGVALLAPAYLDRLTTALSGPAPVAAPQPAEDAGRFGRLRTVSDRSPPQRERAPGPSQNVGH